MGRVNISVRTELRDTLKLAGPIVVSQVGHMSMALVDTMVAGRISTVAQAGLGLAATFYWTFTSICAGCLLALDTYFSQAVGAKDERSLSQYLGQSFWTCGMVALVSAVVIVVGHVAYVTCTAANETREAFTTYMQNVIWSLPGIFLFVVLQRYWQARRRVMAITIMIVAANLLNFFGCLALGLGYWGFPRMGVQGLALATVVCRYLMLIAAIVFTIRALRPASLRLPRLDWSIQREFFRLGLPAGSHTALEIGAFTIATFVVAKLGAIPLAAHHISLVMASFTFMFPLGFSAAAAVRVGMFMGAGEPERARWAGWLCIIVSMTVMSCFALGYLLFPRQVLGWFTQDQAVVEVGAKILFLVALFQIADGTQVSTTGALRGLGNTRAAMFANLIGHYPIGLALGFALCFGFGFGVVGLWAGLAFGLGSVAVMLLRAWLVLTRNISALRPVLSGTTSPVPEFPAK
jgi:MATE family multidrug resistance protein